jgi:hypothetical protein
VVKWKRIYGAEKTYFYISHSNKPPLEQLHLQYRRGNRNETQVSYQVLLTTTHWGSNKRQYLIMKTFVSSSSS